MVCADRLKLDAEVGEFGEARSSGSVRFTLDPETAAAARQELKAPPNCVGLISIGCTIRGDIDGTAHTRTRTRMRSRLHTFVLALMPTCGECADPEFELGELAGSITNLLLMGKPFFKFHSHKSTTLVLVRLFFSLFSLFFHFLSCPRKPGDHASNTRGAPSTDQ